MTINSADVADMRVCHSLVVPVDGERDGDPPAWRCHVPDADLDDRVRRESLRPVPAAHPIRRVLVRSPERAFLVIVARRSEVSEHGLLQLARGRRAPSAAPAADPPGACAPEWGLGSPARAGILRRLPVTAPAAMLLPAAALVLAAYTGDSTVSVGLGGTGRQVTVPPAETPTADFLAGLSAEQTTDEPTAVGILVSSSEEGRRYLPYLAPRYPLTLHGRAEDGTFNGWCQFDEGTVDPGVAEAFVSCVERVAAWLVPGTGTLDDVRFVEPEPGPAVTPARHDRIDRVISRIARRRPDATAVLDDKTELTYRELDERADRFAAGLHGLGARPGELIGICLDRDVDLVVAMLGVLKAGCGYVPLEPQSPPDRLGYVAEDAGLRWIVGDLAGFPGATVVTVSEVTADVSAPVHEGSADDTAYVIYTSGSTGRPKGVVVPHRNVLALMDATRRDFTLGPDDTWTMFHSSAFDFSVWEIWGCLLTGGTLVVVSYWTARDTGAFHHLLATRRVTVLSQTPSAFGQLIRADLESGVALAVRLVVLGGEPLDVRGLAPWFGRHSPSSCRVVNMFGITETTVHVTAQDLGPAEVVAGSRSVGRALPGWTVSVREGAGRVLPPGAAGEICVSGAGVADGYLGRPELTAERFVHDAVTGVRYYRSGDRGRLHPGGELDHLGRIDNQVKIRGYRIELDEIRAVLVNDAGAAAAVVTVGRSDPDDPASSRIDAYVVLPEGKGVDEVWTEARRLLPDYMAPSTITPIAEVPLTTNGKADLAALPRPEFRQGTGEPAEATGDGDLGRDILAIWARHLNAEVTEEDNFFELGGNSLLVERVLITMRTRRMPKVSARDFYLNSTAGRFIELVTQRSAARS